MAIILQTTTGTQEDVNAALGLPPDQAPAEGAPGVSGTVDELPAAAATPGTEAAPAGGEPAAPAGGEPAAAPGAAAADPDPDEDEDEDEDEDPEPGSERAARSSRTKLQTIKHLRRRSRDAEQKAALLEGELASERRMREELQRLATGQPTARPPAAAPVVQPPSAALEPPADDPEPTRDGFENEVDPEAAFVKATAAWATRQENRKAEAARKADADKAAATTAEAQARQRVAGHITKFMESHPDYATVIANPALKISAPMRDILTDPDNENGPAVAYHLGQHPDECARIAALPWRQAIKAMGVLESQVVKPAAAGKPAAPAPAAPVPRAPQPPTPVRAASAPSTQSLEEQAKHIKPGSSGTSDWIARRNAEVARKGGL